MKKLFVFAYDDNPYEDELVCAKELLNSDSLTVSLNELTVDYLEANCIDVVISTALPRQWYFILKGMNIVAITLGRRDLYYDLADIVIDSKNDDVKRYFVSREHSICNNKGFRFGAIAELISKLDWDSVFFGFNVAFLSCMHLTENIYHRIERYIEDEKIRLVEYLCNCHDQRSVLVAEDNGFRFTDIRLNFKKKITQSYNVNLPEGITFNQAQKKDIPALKKISQALYSDSRYIFDRNFDPTKISEFYQGWVEKGVLGLYDDECWCLYDMMQPVAFCTVRYLAENAASIGLVGIESNYHSRGLGKNLLRSVLNLLRSHGVKRVNVVTQGRNYGAQNLYQSLGFRTKTTQLWYHKWV